MFKRKSKNQEETQATESVDSTLLTEKRRKRLLRISIVGNVLFLLGVMVFSVSAAMVHQSNTNPEFCGTCHVMESHVDSYLNGDTLDHMHAEAGVGCKDCHDFPLSAEIETGITFISGDYEVDEDGELFKRDFGDEICTQCHISMEHLATKTDFLYYNPHGDRMGTFTCNTCHLSHGEQIDYCNECHESEGQRMVGDTTLREEIIGKPVSPYSGMWGN